MKDVSLQYSICHLSVMNKVVFDSKSQCGHSFKKNVSLIIWR